MRPVVLFVGAAAIGLAGAVASMAMFPPRSTGSSITVPIDPPPAGKPDAEPDHSVQLPPSPTPEAGLTPIADSFEPLVPAGGAVTVCEGYPAVELVDNRLLNHIPYAETPQGELVAPPAGFGGGNCSQIDREMKPSLDRMIAAATKDDPAVGAGMKGISCFRSVARQKGLFCNPGKIATRGIAGQAKWVAPGGFSEHATGYAIDFGVKSMPQCDVSPCFANTRTGQWLARHARDYGFQLSFPNGNRQGVSFEPWHYRWVGSPRAKAVFARASRDFN